MCNVRNWTLRKQITVLFVVSTAIFLALLSIVVIINLRIMYSDTRTSARSILKIYTYDNMEFISQESGLAFLEKVKLLATMNTDLASLLTIAQGGQQYLPDITVQNPTVDPTYTYTTLNAASGSSFAASTLYGGASVSYAASVVYYPDPSILTENPAPTGLTDLNTFITNSGSLNKYLPSILTTQKAKDIVFINIYYNNNDLEVLRVFPAYPISSTYQPGASVWYKATKAFNLTVSNDWIKIIGPYMDTERTGNKLVAISYPLVSNSQLIGCICVEFLTDTIDAMIDSITFLSAGEAALINSDYNIISAPASWGLNSTQVYSIDDTTINKYVGIKSSAILEGPTDSGSTLTSISRTVSSTDSSVIDYYLTQSLFNVSAQVTTSWLYGVFLYTKVSDADSVSAMLDDLMNSDLITILIISIIAVILTLVIVACVSFSISTRISRPLRKLMEFSDLVNKNNANKTLANKFFQGMDTDESLMGELIQVYKNVIGVSAEPTKSRYLTKNQTAKKEEIEYPLNQFHSEFIAKTQGESPINWKHLIDQIPSEDKKYN